MQEFNIVSLLQKFSGEIVTVAALSTFIVALIKKRAKFSDKAFLVITFFVGTALYIPIGILLKEVVAMIVANSITCGVLSGMLSLLMKKWTNYTASDIKKSLEKLLSSIVLSEQLDEVVDGILEKLIKYNETTANDLKELIKQNVKADLSEEDLKNIVSFIISACDLETKKTEK